MVKDGFRLTNQDMTVIAQCRECNLCHRMNIHAVDIRLKYSNMLQSVT